MRASSLLVHKGYCLLAMPSRRLFFAIGTGETEGDVEQVQINIDGLDQKLAAASGCRW